MKLSFLCPSYNHARYIGKFLESLCAQTDPEWEAIVVDDASPDGTADIVEQFSDPRVRLIRHGYNLGMTAGLNDAFAVSTGELVTFFGTDDILKPDFVAKMKKAFSCDGSVVAAYSPLAAIDESGSETGRVIPLPSVPQERLFADMVINWNQLLSPGMTVRRSVMSDMMPLPEGMVMYTDYLLNLELLYCGKAVLLSDPVVCYRTAKSKAAGISLKSDVTSMREALEVDGLMNRVVKIIGGDLARFNQLFRQFGIEARDCADIPYLLGKAALMSPMLEKRKWGARAMMNALSNRADSERLHREFGLVYADYLKATADVAASDRLPVKCRRLRKRCRILTVVAMFLLGGIFAAMVAFCIILRAM
jgi:glycosyltransferase involved in cell wall biosynthesis